MATIRWIASTVACAAVSLTAAAASERLAGPYPAEVERVLDGDTLAVRVPIWIGQELSVFVRIRGIDAPEMRGRCDQEKARARAATSALEELVSGGSVALSAIEGDKYFGRVIADVTTPAGANVGAALVAGGYVRVYHGGERQLWCGGGTIGGIVDPHEAVGLAAVQP